MKHAVVAMLCCLSGWGALRAEEKAEKTEKAPVVVVKADAAKSDTAKADKKKSAKDKKSPGGAEIWAQNCRRCHNSRPPNTLSDDDWEVVVNHMRIRANLTAEEARKITAFFKMAN